MTNIYDLSNELERGIRALSTKLLQRKRRSQLMLRLVLFQRVHYFKRIYAKMQLVQCQQHNVVVQELAKVEAALERILGCTTRLVCLFE